MSLSSLVPPADRTAAAAMSHAADTHDAAAKRALLPAFNGNNWPVYKSRVSGIFDEKALRRVVERPLADDAAHVQALMKWDGEDEDDLAAIAQPLGLLADASASSTTTVTATGAKKKPTAKELATLVQKSRAAYGAILRSISDTLLVQVEQGITKGDAHALWSNLLAKYERKTVASQHHTRGKLHAMKMERDESFDSYLSRVQEVCIRLVDMHCPVNDAELVYVVLQGLPPMYEFVVESLKAIADLRLENVVERCRDFQETNAHRRTSRRLTRAHKHARTCVVRTALHGAQLRQCVLASSAARCCPLLLLAAVQASLGCSAGTNAKYGCLRLVRSKLPMIRLSPG
jgi:gag-polypeptide of LTR copia-type